jgi:2-dehydro-3-deoxygalactonokinase
VAAAPSLLGLTPSEVALIGDPALCARYQRALRRAGVAAAIFDGEAAAIAGLWALSPK